MNILVCAKQVPDTTEIKIDPVKKTLIRDGVPSILNTYDTFALETALRLKEAVEGSKVTVISMGPAQAKAILKESLSVGADEVHLITDRAFGGSDTLATSYILTCAIKKLEKENGPFDVIFCGKQAIDGDTAQVGPEIAEHLDIPQVTYAVGVEAPDNKTIRVKKEADSGYEVIEMDTPCLVTVTKTPYEMRFPTIKMKLKANKAEIPEIVAADLDIDLAHAGLNGSPTKVKKSFTPEPKGTGIIIEAGEDVNAAIAELLDLLSDAKIL